MGRKLSFNWDDANKAHIARHDVSPAEFEEAFLAPMVESIVERGGEWRVASYGKTKAGRYLFLAYTMRQGSIRPVTAHTLPRSKRSIYDKIIEKL